MSYFLTSRKPNLIYKLFLFSFKKNSEIKSKKKLKFLFLQNNKVPSLRYLLFLLIIILTGRIFNKKIRANIKYEDIEIGSYIISLTYNNFKSYNSNFFFFFFFLKNFFLAGCYIETSKKYLKNYDFKYVYLDHLMYLNGIYHQIFAKNKKTIYCNNYPRSACKINFEKRNNKYINFSNIYSLEYLKENLNFKNKKKVENFKKKYKEKTFKYITWMQNTKYKKLDSLSKLRFDDYQYIIFTHSFTDAQLMGGFDGFETTYDWLVFTLNFLKKKNKKAIVKSHPNFFNPSLGINSSWDKKIFHRIYDEYKNDENFYFINKSINNLEVLRKLNKNCIGITHHGTVILEMALHKLKIITSSKCLWDIKYKISNKWSNVD
jgi:hypothetical protein